MSALASSVTPAPYWWNHPDRPCRGRTDEWFLDDREYGQGSARRERVEELIALCDQCPVLEPCRKDAISISRSGRSVFAVQGGLEPEFRARAKR